MILLYEIDFHVKTGDIISTIRKAFVDAESVSECRVTASEMLENMPESRYQQVYTHISEV